MREIRNEKGQILLISFIIMVILTAITSAFIFMTSARSRSLVHHISRIEAFWLAEAGLQQGIYEIIKSGFEFRPKWPKCPENLEAELPECSTCTTISGELKEMKEMKDEEDEEDEEPNVIGTYDVKICERDPNDFYPLYTLISTGTVEELKRTITQRVVYAPGAFNYAIHASGHVHFNNSEGTIEGNISANGKVMHPDDMDITGGIHEDSGVVTPSVDFSSYLAMTDPNTQLIPENMTFNETDSPYSGIWFVYGEVSIEDDVTINGTIVAMGNIHLTNSDNLTINPDPTHYPALISGNNILGQHLEDSTINGLVYAEGNINFQHIEDTNIEGTIISHGNIELQQGEDYSVIYNPDILQDPPPGFSGGETAIPLPDWEEG